MLSFLCYSCLGPRPLEGHAFWRFSADALRNDSRTGAYYSIQYVTICSIPYDNMYGVHVYIPNMSYALHVYMYMHNMCVYIQYVNI